MRLKENPYCEWTIFEKQVECEVYTHAVLKCPHDSRAQVEGFQAYRVIERAAFERAMKERDLASTGLHRMHADYEDAKKQLSDIKLELTKLRMMVLPKKLNQLERISDNDGGI